MARLPKNSLANHSDAARLVSEWHPTKNGDLTPETVSFTAAKKVWWLGKCGHEWDMAVHARTKSGQNCPYCSGKRVLAGFNDLATTHPHLAAQWHPELNTLSLQEVSAGSTKKAWWLGDCKHEWEAAVQSRKKGSGCPYCANRKVLAGFNDLASRQELAHIVLEWHPENVLKPTEVMPNSNTSVKWMCSNDSTHEWEAMIANRTRVGSFLILILLESLMTLLLVRVLLLASSLTGAQWGANYSRPHNYCIVGGVENSPYDRTRRESGVSLWRYAMFYDPAAGGLHTPETLPAGGACNTYYNRINS